MPERIEDVHMRIDEPLEVRKTILEAAIYSTEILKSFEDLKKIQENRLREKARLKRTFNTIKRLTNNLKREIPAMATEKKKEKKIKKVKVPKIKIIIPKKRLTEVDKLNEELRDIRDKIKGLKI